MMRTTAPIRVPATRATRPSQQVRARLSSNRRLAYFLPVLSSLLTACESPAMTFAGFSAVTILAFVAFAVKMIMKSDAAQLKASRAEADRRDERIQRQGGRIRREIEFGFATETPATKPVINISRLQSEDILLHCLQQGNKITVYRGYNPEYVPEVGQEYTQTFSGTPERRAELLEKAPLEQLIEEARQEHFPGSPSRLDSVFATTSITDAQEFGEAYELEISLRPEAASAERIPVRWLDRNTVDYLAGFRVEGNEDIILGTAQAYWRESGSHHGISDILLDPNLVEIRVIGKV
ncbi:MAG: hypothetical protein ABID35_07655 [Candidatus Margulisiibacteriota bacterium]